MDKILVLDLGGQYDQLIARRVRNEQVYAQIREYDDISPEQIVKEGFRGIIFTGGPDSVYEEDSPKVDQKILDLGIPILGICYGHQLLAHLAGGKVASAGQNSEFGKTLISVDDDPLFKDLPRQNSVWMSHADEVKEIPAGFRIIARSGSCACVGMADPDRKLYGVQFHPEVSHSEHGQTIIRNFLFAICGCQAQWRMTDLRSSIVAKYREELKGHKVLLGLSGGVDSLVAAVLLHEAIGDDLICVLIDHGLLRKNEAVMIREMIEERFNMKIDVISAEERFLKQLQGVSDPERKRKIIGETFVRVFEETAKDLDADILAQGTIYPDVIESGKGKSAVIKSHHNVGGLPEDVRFEKIIEPLRDLFKDEVRQLGERLEIPETLLYRQPFPGPGLAVRIIGEVTAAKLELLKQADEIFREETERTGQQPDQYFAVLSDLRSVGVKGDARSYGMTIILRAVVSDDFMTANWARLPYELLETVSDRITNEIPGIGRVVYDITSKPPATIEWE